MSSTKSDCVDHGRKGFGLGYATAWRVVDGVRVSTTLHRAIFYDHTGSMPEVVRHTCDNPRCINWWHLEAGTQVDNMADMHDRGRGGDCRNFGAANGRTVTSVGDVQFIRVHYTKGSRDFGLPALARRFGISTSQVHRIVKEVHHAGI